MTKYSSILTIFILLHPLFLNATVSSSDTLISRCKAVLQEDFAYYEVREKSISLVKEIEEQEELYLKSALYPDVRQYYEKLLVKLGEYYFEQKDFKNALQCYAKADKYSTLGYSEKIKTTNFIAEGSYYYKRGKYDIAEFAFMRALRINRREKVAREYLEKTAEWKKVTAITLQAFLQFKKYNRWSSILDEYKEKLYEKYSNLPPEDYLEYLEGKNKNGYWEAKFKGHIMVYIPLTYYGSGGFFVDKYEVSYAQLETVKDFENKRKKSKTPLISKLRGYHPAVVSFKDAELYCSQKGFRLLTEEEWEMIAGNNEKYTYPWGNQEVDGWDITKGERIYRANYDDSMYYRDGYETAAPVKSFEDYASPYGIVNLSGNVWEWVQGKKCKGGGFLSGKEDLKIKSSSRDETWVGFRCVKETRK